MPTHLTRLGATLLLAVARDLTPQTKLFAKYRILEGGSDKDEVCTS